MRRSLNGDLTLWQRRFWEHTIRNERDFARHVDYIHFNLVKYGLASRVSDWPHSSFHRYVHEGVLPLDWGGDMGRRRKLRRTARMMGPTPDVAALIRATSLERDPSRRRARR